MPRITAPSDEVIESPPIEINFTGSGNERIRRHLDIKPWMCPSCNLKNFGHNTYCANFRCRIDRPKDFKEERRDA